MGEEDIGFFPLECCQGCVITNTYCCVILECIFLKKKGKSTIIGENYLFLRIVLKIELRYITFH